MISLPDIQSESQAVPSDSAISAARASERSISLVTFTQRAPVAAVSMRRTKSRTSLPLLTVRSV